MAACSADRQLLVIGGSSRRVIAIKWNTAAVHPNPRPISINNNLVPNLSSNQWPANPGNTISIATTMMRVAQV
jgi:hypothetical protein